MRCPAADTAEKHERILREVSRLFRARDFAGVSVSEVTKAAGLTHGALYAHFPSKDAIACAGLDAAVDGMAPSTAADDRGSKAAFVARYLSAAHKDNPAQGCAMAALGGAVAREPALRRSFTVGLKRDVARTASRFAWGRQAEPEVLGADRDLGRCDGARTRGR